MSSNEKSVEVQQPSQPSQVAGEDSWLPDPNPGLKPERIQDVLQREEVRDRVSAFVAKLATCDRQRVRVDLTGGRVVLSVQGTPRPGQMDELMQAALELGHVA
jgi:hypothetical protein